MTLKSSLLLLIGLTGVACGTQDATEEAPPNPVRFVALELQAVQPDPSEPGEIEIYRQLKPSPDSIWPSVGCQSEVVLEGDISSIEAQFSLVLNCEQDAVLNIPGPFDGHAFNAVALEIEYQGKRDFRLDFISQGKTSATHGRASSKSKAGRQVLQFELPTLYRVDEQISRLRLAILDGVQDLRIHSLSLLQRPMSLRLPSPATGADLILVADESRRAVGRSAGQGLTTQLVPQEGSVLRFSYAAPGQAQDGPAAPALRLTLTAASGQTLTRRFAATGDSEYSWYTARVPLAQFAGQSLQLLFELLDNPGDVWALAELGVLQGTGDPQRVLLITSDTHRADHLGSAGLGVTVRTPTLDALAERGVLFEDCLTATNITNPSHIALMTGTHPRDTGILSNNEPISRVADTLAEAFRAAGYATFASVSVTHLGDRTSGLGQGFDRMSDPQIRGLWHGNKSLDVLLRWIDENRDLPLFLWLHMFDAHVPYEPPDKILATYYPDRAAAFDPKALAPAGVPAHVYDSIFPGLKDLNYPKALYAGEVTFLDRQLSRILNHPDFALAVIAFTADHGESLGQHGVFYAHADLYPDSLHVPLILAYPGAKAGERRKAPVRQIDVGRTLLDLAGLYSVEFPGNNLLDEQSAVASDREPRFALGAGFQTASITLNGWHLILALTEIKGRHRTQGRPLHQVSLFQLDRDPEATHDLLEEQFERARDLRKRLLDWLAATDDRGWRGARITDEKTLSALKALGYSASTADNSERQPMYEVGCDCEWCERFNH